MIHSPFSIAQWTFNFRISYELYANSVRSHYTTALHIIAQRMMKLGQSNVPAFLPPKGQKCGILMGRYPTKTPHIIRLEGLHGRKLPYAIALFRISFGSSNLKPFFAGIANCCAVSTTRRNLLSISMAPRFILMLDSARHSSSLWPKSPKRQSFLIKAEWQRITQRLASVFKFQGNEKSPTDVFV